ncbi:MAG: hypothetical protein C0394_03450 [Syntrophus sp. (in: bacteria)]|nr:hypothetical protein [Syntrophus sp. (in: bacteria)]
MKVDLQRTESMLPAPVGAEVLICRPARIHAGYGISGVIDTVEVRRGNFQALPANRQDKNLSTPQTGKGLYIDVWA